MRHLKKFDTISEYTTAEPTLSMPSFSFIVEDNSVRNVRDDEIVFIEYLQATGTQYIDSLISSNSTIEYELCYELISGSSTGIMSYRPDTGSTKARGVWVTSGSVAINTYGSDSGWKTLANGKHIVKTEGASLYADNALLVTVPNNNAYEYDSTSTIGIFRSRVGTGWDSRTGANIKMYWSKIWSKGTLVRDFIPVRIGTVGYLYDTVSKRLFANSGSGNFTLGPDITAVEYLASDGNQYIDTGIIPNISTGIKISYMKQSTSTDRSEAIFGLRNEQNTSSCWYAVSVKGTSSQPTYIQFGRQTYWSVGAHQAPYDVINTISLNYFNNRKSTTSNTNMTFDFSGAGSYNFNYDPMFTALYDIRLFGMAGYKSYQNLIGRIYGCTISQGNKIIMDMIPVRIGTEGCMFDKVSRRFFRNNGTGNLTYGSDVAGVNLVNRKEYLIFK